MWDKRLFTPNNCLTSTLCAQAGALTGTEAWRAGERARALEQAFLELDRQLAAPENRAELAELAGAQDDEDPQCAPGSARMPYMLQQSKVDLH